MFLVRVITFSENALHFNFCVITCNYIIFYIVEKLIKETPNHMKQGIKKSSMPCMHWGTETASSLNPLEHEFYWSSKLILSIYSPSSSTRPDITSSTSSKQSSTAALVYIYVLGSETIKNLRKIPLQWIIKFVIDINLKIYYFGKENSTMCYNSTFKIQEIPKSHNCLTPKLLDLRF